jgi:hypothetical protein
VALPSLARQMLGAAAIPLAPAQKIYEKIKSGKMNKERKPFRQSVKEFFKNGDLMKKVAKGVVIVAGLSLTSVVLNGCAEVYADSVNNNVEDIVSDDELQPGAENAVQNTSTAQSLVGKTAAGEIVENERAAFSKEYGDKFILSKEGFVCDKDTRQMVPVIKVDGKYVISDDGRFKCIAPDENSMMKHADVVRHGFSTTELDKHGGLIKVSQENGVEMPDPAPEPVNPFPNQPMQSTARSTRQPNLENYEIAAETKAGSAPVAAKPEEWFRDDDVKPPAPVTIASSRHLSNDEQTAYSIATDNAAAELGGAKFIKNPDGTYRKATAEDYLGK